MADCSQNRQSAKINSPPKFPAIRYVYIQLCMYVYMPQCMYICHNVCIYATMYVYSRLDWYITGIKKPHLLSQVLLNPAILRPSMEGVLIIMEVSINWHCCRPNPSTKTLQETATDLSRRLLRASCNGRNFCSLNSLAWIDLSQQRCGFATTVLVSYSDVKYYI